MKCGWHLIFEPALEHLTTSYVEIIKRLRGLLVDPKIIGQGPLYWRRSETLFLCRSVFQRTRLLPPAIHVIILQEFFDWCFALKLFQFYLFKLQAFTRELSLWIVRGIIEHDPPSYQFLSYFKVSFISLYTTSRLHPWVSELYGQGESGIIWIKIYLLNFYSGKKNLKKVIKLYLYKY